MKVILTTGLPGSGKSTWAKEYCEKHLDWVRVNRDDLRNMRGLYWLPKDEDMITEWELSAIELALANGKDVIVDATNLNPQYNARMLKFIEKQYPGIQISTKTFDISPEECIKRDLKRANSVGAEVIWGMYYKYIAPIPVYNEDAKLPHCIIVDIDGSIAENVSGRSPFDWKRVGEDRVIVPTKTIVNSFANMGHTVILFSGRDSICRRETEKWLQDNDVLYDALWMRPNGDSRKDSIIKKELFEKYVRGKHYVDFVIDDRKQVKRMWVGELGLFVLDVNQHDKEF